jgi:hypothetical protein
MRAVITGGGWPHVVKVEHEEADRVQAVRGLQHAGEYRSSKGDFESFYRAQVERIIEQYKEKLPSP